MRIIRAGRDMPERYTGECTLCGCVIEVDRDEIKSWGLGMGPKGACYADWRCPTRNCPGVIDLYVIEK